MSLSQFYRGSFCHPSELDDIKFKPGSLDEDVETRIRGTIVRGYPGIPWPVHIRPALDIIVIWLSGSLPEQEEKEQCHCYYPADNPANETPVDSWLDGGCWRGCWR